jgi:hypothetical protein
MRVLLLALSLLVSLSALATTNDLPKIVWSCSETYQGTPVLDGGKKLIIARDQFRQFTLTLIQKDQFSGDRLVLQELPVVPEKCSGFTPCEKYDISAPLIKGEFFINLVSQDPKAGQEGLLSLAVNGGQLVLTDFSCKAR